MSIVKNFITDPLNKSLAKSTQGIPISLKKLSKFTNYIEKGQNIVISGRPGVGKSAFMDNIYFMNVFIWWLELPEDKRPPIKFLYFNLSNKNVTKIQKWLCLYLKLKKSILMDIPTFNNGIGKMYELTDDITDEIIDSYDFFEELEEHLAIFNGPMTVSEINNSIKNYMSTVGDFNEENKFELNDEHLGQITLTYIDNTDDLIPESDGFTMMNEQGTKKKLALDLNKLKRDYNITNVIITNSKISNSRMVRDSEPSYKDLDYFSKVADIGIVIYSPYEENNNKYLNYPIEDMIIANKNRFKTATVVRNTLGVNNITVGLIFLGECGYFAEAPHPQEQEAWDTLLETLNNIK